MSAAVHDICITGMGVLCAAGRGVPAFADALRSDRFLGRPQASALPVPVAGAYPDLLPEIPGFPDDRKADLAHAAFLDALADAGLSAPGGPGPALPPPARRALFLGTGLSSCTPRELAEDLYPHLSAAGHFDRAAMARDLAADRAAPRRHLPARVTAALAQAFGVEGPTGTSFSACAAAAQAMLEGAWALRRGEADIAIVGGHDSMIHPLGMLSFVVLGALSPSRCRPFDRGRDGFMIGEGAAIFVLERADRARARGARVRARLLGGGTSVDAWNATAPHPEGKGAELAMRRALRDARVAAEDVGYVNFHGTGTPLGDKAESQAVARVFGPDVACSSIKGAVGHTIAAAGAVEAAACVIALQEGFLPGTVGLDDPDELPVRPLRAAQEARPRAVLSNSFGFGGQNCALLLGPA